MFKKAQFTQCLSLSTDRQSEQLMERAANTGFGDTECSLF